MHTDTVVAIMGATATGKTELAIRLAEAYSGEVVSMDSRQAYRGLDIGTGKATADDRRRVPHHLLDTLAPDEPNSAGKHTALARVAIRDIRSRDHTPILAGGTGLYFRALFHGLIDVSIPDDELVRIRERLASRTTEELYDSLAQADRRRANELSRKDRVRILRALEILHHTGKTYSEHVAAQAGGGMKQAIKIVLTMPRPLLRRRIAARTREMFAAGWVEEVRRLIAAGVSTESPAMRSLGYDRIAEALAAGKDPSEVVQPIITQTQQYAKRQETFFRSETDAVWIDVTHGNAMQRVARLVEALNPT